ncbi:MAG: hypothetical protein FJ387_26450, partial [Verrucomicrobia bacterium]|nr:hypothetical protein [Verrucomicrobiota bacterium]
MKTTSLFRAPSARWWLAAVATVCLGTLSAQAQRDKPDPGRMREEAAKLERKAQDLKAAGQHDEARRVLHEAELLAQRSKELRHDMDRKAPERAEAKAKMERLHAELKELQAAGKMDRAAEVKERLAQLEREFAKPGEPKPGRPKALGAEAKLDQLRGELKELQAAGKMDRAAEVKERLAQLEREFAKPGEPKPGRPKALGAEAKLDQLRGELKELQAAGKMDRAAEVKERLEQLEREFAKPREPKPGQPKAERRIEVRVERLIERGEEPVRGPEARAEWERRRHHIEVALDNLR